MKLNLYYVVRVYEGGTDSIGRSDDCEYVAGPFKSYSGALEAKRETNLISNRLEVVTQTVEVNE